MKACAHTMSTPDLDVFEATHLFAEVGYRYVEIISAADYRCSVFTNWNQVERDRLRRHLEGLNLTQVNLSTYLRAVNSFDRDEQSAALEEARKAIQLAHDLQFKAIRFDAGYGVPDNRKKEATDQFVEVLTEMGRFAEPYGVELWVENHMDTLAETGYGTADMLRRTGLANVGIIYDQANLREMGAEPFDQAIMNQLPFIRHVHVKDVIWREGSRKPTMFTEGDMVWEPVFQKLWNEGYRGCVSYECEKRWHPELLPDSRTALEKGYRYISGLIYQLEKLKEEED